MSDAGWRLTDGDVKALRAFMDAILPGDRNRWPAASAAIDIARLLNEISDDDADWLLQVARKLAQQAAAMRSAAASAVEHDEPQHFGRAVQALYRVYYTSAPVLAVVEAIADSGPRETSPHFDKSLVAQVLATRAAQRRM